MDRSFPRFRAYRESARREIFRGQVGRGLLLFCVLASGAAWAQLPQLRVNDEPDGEANRFDPALVRLSDGRYFLTWSDQAMGSTDLFSRILSPDPVPAGSPIRVNDDATLSDHGQATVSQPGGDRFVVAWIDGRSGGSDLYAQVFSASTGLPIGPNLRLNDAPGIGRMRAPTLATNAQGQTLACWMDNRVNQYRIAATRINADGTRQGSNLFPAPGDPKDPQRVQRNPALAALPDGGWLLAWDEGGATGFAARFQFLSAIGQPQGLPVSPAPEQAIGQSDPAVLVRADDFLIVWTDERQGTNDVWGQWFEMDGRPQGGNMLMQSAAVAGQDISAQLFPAPDGSFALTWFGSVQGRERPLVRCFSVAGVPLAVEEPMRDPPVGVIAGPGVAAPADQGRWLIAWNDAWAQSQDVYLDRVDPASGPMGQVQPVFSEPRSANQTLPDVAFFPGGHAVVVWADGRSGELVISARLLDHLGNPDSLPSFRVNTVNTGRRYLLDDLPEDIANFAPAVAASGIGTFVVTWAVDSGGGRLTVYGQLYDRSARPVGDNFTISKIRPGPQHGPQLGARPAMGLDGRFAIAWQDDIQDEGGDIYLQRYDAQGDTVGRPILVNEVGAARAQQSPDIAFTPYNEMVVTWIDRRESGWDICRQRLSANGLRQDSLDVQISPPDGPNQDQFYPSIAANGDAIVTVWDDLPLTRGLISGRLEILESKSRRTTPVDFTVNPLRHPLGVKRPKVAMERGGQFIVVWWDQQEGLTNVWAQRYDPTGAAIGRSYAIAEGITDGHRSHPSVSVNPNRIQFVWEDTREGRGWDIYSRRVGWLYNGDPTPVALNFWEATPTADGIEVSWSVPLSSDGALFRLWRDDDEGEEPPQRPSSRAILLTPEHLRPGDDGRFLVVDRVVAPGRSVFYYLEATDLTGESQFFGPLPAVSGPAPWSLWRVAPNPFADRVEFLPPRPGAASLEICDVAGRRLRVLERGEASVSPLSWDGRDAAGHPVSAGIYLARTRPASDVSNRSNVPGMSNMGANRVFRVVRIR